MEMIWDNSDNSAVLARVLEGVLADKNNEAQIWPKIKKNVRTIQAGIWNYET